MIFFHSYLPSAIAFLVGPITVYWYGIIMALSLVAAITLAIRIGKRYGVTPETMMDAAIWLIIGGLVGARIYEIFLSSDFYFSQPAEIIKIWHGGLAIHGGIIGGTTALIVFAKKKKLDSWKLAAAVAPALALGQAIGRWGNWFNQELFGRPTDLPWGIPIVPFNRPAGYEMSQYFHPTFLYESIGNLIICLLLCFLIKKKIVPKWIVGVYLVLYGFLRFSLEFIKIDPTPLTFGLRWPQIISLILIGIGSWLLLKRS